MKRFLYLLIVLALFSSCKKSKQNKLVGSWELLPQYAYDTLITHVYTFDAANIMYRYKNDSLTDTANYTMVQEFNKFYVDLRDLDIYNDGQYYIEKLNKDVLILQCYSPFMRKEFMRVKE